ncbi:MAG: host attachment protein [Pseudomonadota bacterium]|nr:host attachment protein [Pseudomonadota bacterium]
MSKHWVLVADAAGAKVYESDALLEELTLVEELTHVHDGKLPGAGHGAQEAHHDPHVVAEGRFARAVAKFVNEDRHRFDRLVVVAPPRFLGDLRGELSQAVGNRVVASIHHDWTKLHTRELAAKVRANLPDVAGMP